MDPIEKDFLQLVAGDTGERIHAFSLREEAGRTGEVQSVGNRGREVLRF